jgi:putative membrane protein
MWWSEWWSGSGVGAWMFFAPVMMVIFVSAFIAVMYLVMRDGAACGGRDERAVSILRERYARGEIDQAEFEKRRRLLET